MPTQTKPQEYTSTLARLEDGTVQLTLTIPQASIQAQKEIALKTLIERLQLPGFRKGKAPVNVAEKHIEKDELYNQVLQNILPTAYIKGVKEHNLEPILSPRFEILKVDENQEWTIRAITCEAPDVILGDYKKNIKGESEKSKIWVPGDSEKETDKKTDSREDKEQKVLDSLIKETEVKIPRLLIEEEINHKLSRLVDQTQKLGLTIEQYLASTGKTAESLRAELGLQAELAIKLELALNKIAEVESVVISETEVNEIIAASGTDQVKEALKNPEQRSLIASVLKRRKALDVLVNLI